MYTRSCTRTHLEREMERVWRMSVCSCWSWLSVSLLSVGAAAALLPGHGAVALASPAAVSAQHVPFIWMETEPPTPNVNLVSSCHQWKNRSSTISAPTKMGKAKCTKEGDKKNNSLNSIRWFTVLFLIKVLTCPFYGDKARDSSSMRETEIDHAPVRLCLCNSSSLLSLSCAPVSTVCLSNVPGCQKHPGTRSWPRFTPVELWEQ